MKNTILAIVLELYLSLTVDDANPTTKPFVLISRMRRGLSSPVTDCVDEPEDGQEREMKERASVSLCKTRSEHVVQEILL